MRLDKGTQKLVWNVALPPQKLPAFTLEVVGLGRFPVARDEHVAKVSEHAAQLQHPQQILRPVTGETRCPRELGDRQEAVAVPAPLRE